MVYNPIYRDTYYTSSASSLVYQIKLEGGVIYSGRAVRMPGADNLRININKVCRNYLESDITPLFETNGTSITNLNACRTFDLTDSAGTVLQQYTFLLDYDYDDTWNGGSKVLSVPINGHFISGMLKPRTSVSTGNTVSTNATTGNYQTQVKCSDYVLYYLNARGGWDAFVPEGKCQKKDGLTTYTTDRAFDNTTYEFETNRYVSEIKTSYELSTGLLTDEQSERLAKHLIGSNKVYLHNVKDGWIRPVVIDDKAVTYQTYENNGKKMSVYKINVTESQMRIRK